MKIYQRTLQNAQKNKADKQLASKAGAKVGIQNIQNKYINEKMREKDEKRANPPWGTPLQLIIRVHLSGFISSLSGYIYSGDCFLLAI
jgi:hypothetical protein